MMEVVRVRTKKQQKDFIEFPLRLYRDCPYFVPPLYGDEKKMFRKDFVYADTCEMACFNAYRDGKMVGRIQGILQKASNEKNHEKRVRFNRFDALNDPGIAEALFDAVEDWGRSLGMGYGTVMKEVILPQAIKNILPALGNELITLFKDTSLVSVIGMTELTKVARDIQARTYLPMMPYLGIALMYLVVVIIMTWLLGKLERRMRRSDRR